MSCGLDICYCQSNSIIYNILYCFNTSHVTLYRKYSCQNSRRRWVSIHLMLLFIFFCILFLLSPSWFQYISCYSLSMRFIMDLLRRKCFNTSHVTLYPTVKRSLTSSMKRFNTSHVTLYRELADCLDYDVIRFNTSHVTLYHNQITTQESIKRSFNTSHVTLYRCKGPRKCPGSLVSIHLMLLFIYSRWSLMRTKWRFNTSHVTLYLMFPFYDKREPRCFNTSHVTLYRQKKKLLLLRLIGFNTSHVTLYPCPDCCNRKSDQCFNTSHVTLYRVQDRKLLFL